MDVLETFGMKVTKATLQRIIQEELSRVLQEQGSLGYSGPDPANALDTGEIMQVVQALMAGGLDHHSANQKMAGVDRGTAWVADILSGQQPGSQAELDKYPDWFDGEFDLWWSEWDDGDMMLSSNDVKKFAWTAFRMWLDKPNKVPPVAKTLAGPKGHTMASDLTGGFADVGFTVGSGLWTEDGYINWTTGDPNPQHSNPNKDWYKQYHTGDITGPPPTQEEQDEEEIRYAAGRPWDHN